jgi:hypothetical protein
MKSKILYITLTVLAIGGLAGWYFFGNRNSHLKVVPKSALFVYTADVLSLAKKADFKKLRELPLYQKMESEVTESESARVDLMRNPMDWGVAFSSPVYGYLDNWEDNSMSCFAFKVDDNKEFEKLLTTVFSRIQIKDKSTFQYARVENDFAICWGDRGALVVVPTSYRTNDSEVEKYAEHIYGLKAEETMAKSDAFDDFLDKSGDVSAMLNGSALYELMQKESSTNAKLLEDMSYLKESALIATLNFENDKVEFQTYSMMPDAQQEIAKGILKSGISEQHAALIHDGSPIAISAISFDANKLYEYITSIGVVKNNLNEILAQLQLTEEELKSLLSGEVSYAWNTFKFTEPESAEYTSEQLLLMDPYMRYYYENEMRSREPELYLVTTVNFTTTRFDVVEKLMGNFGRMFGVLPDGEGGYNFPLNYSRTPNFRMSKTAIGYIITNDNDIRTKAMAGKVGELADPAKSMVTQNAMGAWANLDYSTYPAEVKTTLNEEMRYYSAPFESYVSLFKQMSMEGDSEGVKMKIELTPGEGNSLYRLFAQADVAATEYEKAKEARRLEEMQRMEAMEMPEVTGDVQDVPEMQAPY